MAGNGRLFVPTSVSRDQMVRETYAQQVKETEKRLREEARAARAEEAAEPAVEDDTPDDNAAPAASKRSRR